MPSEEFSRLFRSMKPEGPEPEPPKGRYWAPPAPLPPDLARLRARLRSGKGRMIDVPGWLVVHAWELSEILECVAFFPRCGERVPKQWVDAAKRAVEAWLSVNNAPSWQFVLEGLFDRIEKYRRWTDPRDIAEAIAEELVRRAPRAPLEFRDPTREQLKEGAKVVALARGDVRKRGKPPTSWGLARAFAAVFHAPMAKRSDAIRKR